jgi:hypothetical protein
LRARLRRGLRFRLRHRYRGDRAPDRVGAEEAAPTCSPQHVTPRTTAGAYAIWPCCARADPAPRGRRARAVRRCCSAVGRRRQLRGLRHLGPAAGHAADRLSGDGDCAEFNADGYRIVHGPTAPRSSARCTESSCRPMRSSSASTATTCRRRSSSNRRHGQHARDARRGAASSPAVRRQPPKRCSRRIAGLDHRLRHQLPRRSGRALLARIDCRHARATVEVASEYRYRESVPTQTLVVTLSQSGETADTWPRCSTRNRSA